MYITEIIFDNVSTNTVQEIKFLAPVSRQMKLFSINKINIFSKELTSVGKESISPLPPASQFE